MEINTDPILLNVESGSNLFHAKVIERTTSSVLNFGRILRNFFPLLLVKGEFLHLFVLGPPAVLVTLSAIAEMTSALLCRQYSLQHSNPYENAF